MRIAIDQSGKIEHTQSNTVWLLRHIQRVKPSFSAEQIVFRRVGKQSRAHQRALAVFRGLASPDEVRARDLLARLK